MHITKLLHFFTCRENATSIALCRIGIGLTLSLHALRLLTSDTAQIALVHRSHGGLGVYHGALRAIGGATPDNVNALVGALTISGFFVALGLMTRASLFSSWALLHMVSALNPYAQGDYDRLLSQSLFLLLWSGCEKAFSLDQRIHPKLKGGDPTVPLWPRFLIVFHLALLYVGSAMSKISLSWLPFGDGSALWHLAHHPLWVRTSMPPLPIALYDISTVMTRCVWFWEFAWFAWFVFAWLPSQRKHQNAEGASSRLAKIRERVSAGHLAFGICFHITAECFLEIGPFSFAVLSLYFCVVAPETWAHLWGRPKRAHS